MVGVGRLPGTVGMASCLLDAPPPRPATLEELKLRWITRLEERKASWRLALKEVFHRVDADGDGYATLDEFVKMVAATGNCFNQEEGMRLFEVWAGADSKIALNKVTADLSAILSLDESIFNRPDAPTCEGSVVSGSKSRSNLESADSGLKSIDDTSYVPRAISNRNLTAATKSRPLPVLGGAALGWRSRRTIRPASGRPGARCCQQCDDEQRPGWHLCCRKRGHSAAPAEGQSIQRTVNFRRHL